MKKQKIILVLLALCLLVPLATVAFLSIRYRVQPTTYVNLTEAILAQYPEDSTPRSAYSNRYMGRNLWIAQKDARHFDLAFEAQDPHVATIVLKNIDLGLLVPAIPHWIMGEDDLEKVALIERGWNRHHVLFSPNSPALEIIGGDGVERAQLSSAHLVCNGLPAGEWALELYMTENGQSSLYYRGWFSLPLGRYKDLFEKMNGTSYWRHRARLEKGESPEDIRIDVTHLRTMISEVEPRCECPLDEAILVGGEQANKLKLVNSTNIFSWKNLRDHSETLKFARYISPGRYTLEQWHGHELYRISDLNRAFVRKVRSAGSKEMLHELELVFRSSGRESALHRLLVSGIDIPSLPQLRAKEYYLGWHMPLGISVPPPEQPYELLEDQPPHLSSYFCMLLDENGLWVDHRKAGIDGIVLHRDASDETVLHAYLLGYEREAVVGHYIIFLGTKVVRQALPQG